ncbi:MAG: VanW family protein [Oscillospiraceae bacterium]|nr:VanW family protein [Oscillospiraceae bacterium]
MTRAVKQKRKSKKKKIVLIIVIVLLVLAVLSGGALAAVGVSVSNGDTIFPNVSVNGVPVGGLTLEQAADRLEAPMEADRTERAVAVYFPGDTVIEITAEQAGLIFTGREAAEIAYAFGRDGNIFTSGWNFLRGQIVSVDIDPLTHASANRELIRMAVEEAGEEIDLLSMGAYEVVDDYLVVVKGRLVFTFDEDNLVEMIAEAFSKGAHEPVSYETETSEPEPIDLEAVYENIFTEPENAVFDLELEEPTEHVLGVSFDVPLAQTRLELAGMGEEVLIPLIFTEPEITTEFLREVLFRDVLATSTTRLTADENRNTNIVLASAEINGMILNPGDQFDFNTVVGQRTPARGFRPAGVFIGTEIVQNTGGGICQVSSGIYHALLHTDLQVDARINHTMVVTYLPMGMDAAVSWNGPHFSFTNSSPFPLRIIAYRDGQDFHVRLEGTLTHDYRIVPESIQINTIAYTNTYQDDPSIPTGTTQVERRGQRGHVVEVFQRFYDANGTLVRREFVARSTYRAVPQVILRGTGAVATPTPTPPPDYYGTPEE